MGCLFNLLLIGLIIHVFKTYIKGINETSSDNGGQYSGRRYYNPYGNTYGYGQNRKNDFVRALLELIAAVMKADGNAKRVELDYVKTKLVEALGYNEARAAILQLRDILKMQVNLYNSMIQIRTSVDYYSRLTIFHILYGIAAADGVVTADELSLLKNIAMGIGLSEADMQSVIGIQSSSNDIESAYKILEIQSTATDDEVKKAYRKMAMKYHPDKVSGLGEEVVKNAEARFRKVQDAYEKIKNVRGIK